MIRGWQAERVEQRLIGRDCLCVLEALTVTSAEDIQRDRQLITAHRRIGWHLIRVDVDQLDHPVTVGTAGGGEQVDDGRATDMQRRGQWRADIGDYVGTSIDKALVVYQPACPRVMVGEGHWPWQIRHRIGRIGNVLVVFRLCGVGCIERQRMVRFQIQRSGSVRATVVAALRPRFVAIPVIFTGVVDQHRRGIRFWRAVDQILIEERQQDVTTELQRCVTAPLQRTQ